MSSQSTFIHDLRTQCKLHNVRLRFVRSVLVEVQPGIKCAAWFDPSNKEIVIAKKNSEWLSNLVHESSHLDQWIEQSKLWRKEERFGTQIFDRWLLGKRVSSLRKSINNLIALELDCERRSVNKIIKYDLSINTVTYIQKANAILLYYRYLFETSGQWNSEDIKIFNKFPKKFMSDRYYKTRLSDRIKKIFFNAGV